MNRRTIDPVRLFAATEAILVAVEEYERATGKLSPFPPDLLGVPDQPAVLADFTRDEIYEATHFLVRLGLIVVKHTT